jgi:hypothetical protein
MRDYDLLIELEIECNYLLEQDHVYEIQWILNRDPNYKKIEFFLKINMKSLSNHQSSNIALLGTFFG